MHDDYSGQGVDQLAELIHKIKTNPSAAWPAAPSWRGGGGGGGEGVLPPAALRQAGESPPNPQAGRRQGPRQRPNPPFPRAQTTAAWY